MPRWADAQNCDRAYSHRINGRPALTRSVG